MRPALPVRNVFQLARPELVPQVEVTEREHLVAQTVADIYLAQRDAVAELVGASRSEAEQAVNFRDEALTEAEERVAVAVARGLSNKEIAAEFRISVRTVENHISHILSKKGFGNRVEIARHVLGRAQAGDES